MTSPAAPVRVVSASADADVAASTPKAPVLVPFVCPVCAAPNGVNLIALSRAGHTTCVKCEKKLRAADVMRAMHSPRKA